MEASARTASSEEELNRQRSGARMVVRQMWVFRISIRRNKRRQAVQLQIVHELRMVYENRFAIVQIRPRRVDILNSPGYVISQQSLCQRLFVPEILDYPIHRPFFYRRRIFRESFQQDRMRAFHVLSKELFMIEIRTDDNRGNLLRLRISDVFIQFDQFRVCVLYPTRWNLKVKHDVYKAPKFNFRFDPIRNNRASFFVIFARMRVDRQQHR
mmetsp:Transcript_2075/g.6346  ORF Transcript_2075/g.6346 Transcript_2075/m.6346 type:complete len:212 (+) Transcript_2075:849-1484(+)